MGTIIQEIISKSDLSKESLLSLKEGKLLYENFFEIHQSEISQDWISKGGSNCVNIEFIMKDSNLYILQIRPHFFS